MGNLQVYKKLQDEVKNNGKNVSRKNNYIFLAKGKLFLEIIETIPPKLKQKTAEVPLETIYEAGYHTKTKAMFVCNKGAYLLAKTPRNDKYYATAHFGFSVYMPKHGIEIMDVGITGDITKGKFVVMRPESACSPSFIIGSQRCNCYDQWMLVRELAASHNPIKLPKTANIEQFEKYVADYFKPNNKNIPIPKKNGQGFIFIHMASQNGMGSGTDRNNFVEDMTATAYMRHRGEYTAEQVHGASLAGGFTALGLEPDPRKLNDFSGYKVPAVILDYFDVKKPIIALTNNQDKVQTLKRMGFDIIRIQFVGRSDVACGVETKDRRKEFLHAIPINLKISMGQDFKNVNKEIHKIFNDQNKIKEKDDKWMKYAIKLAKEKGRVINKPIVGSVVVKNNKKIGEGYGIQGTNIHAEVMALRQAGARAKEATLYSTLEPCTEELTKSFPKYYSSCVKNILDAGINRVVMGAIDPHPIVNGKGAHQLSKAGVEIGMAAEKEANNLIRGWMKKWNNKNYKK